MTTSEKAISEATKIFARKGYEGLSMRKLAKETGIAPSVLYHHFENKDQLLRAMYNSINTNLEEERGKIQKPRTASALLMQVILFQLDHAEELVASLKYYQSFRDKFRRLKTGYLPGKAYLQILEVLEFGIKNKQFKARDIQKDAKVLTHVINGYLLEYFPSMPRGKDKDKLAREIQSFILRVLKH